MSREILVAVTVGMLMLGALLARLDPTGSFSFRPRRGSPVPSGSCANDAADRAGR